MQVKTILNRIQKHRGFVYGTVQLEGQIVGLALTVDIAPHRRNRVMSNNVIVAMEVRVSSKIGSVRWFLTAGHARLCL